VRRGWISPAQLDASVARIISLKVARGLLSEPAVSPSAGADDADPSRQRNLARQLANRSITVVANDRETASGVRREDRYLPVRSKQVYVAGPAAAGLTAALQPELAATGGRIVASPAQADVIVAATRDAVNDAAQQRLVRGLVASGRPVLVLATGLPYDLGLFPGMRAGVASYSDSSVSLSAAAAVLAGRLPPAGRLPVAIPAAAGGRAFAYGTGLSSWALRG
jgi:beta-N-acetylhexosaminidase